MHRLPLAGLVFAATAVLPAAAHAAPRWLAPVPPFGDVPARQDEAGAAMAQDGRIVFARVAPDGALEVRERPPGGPVAAPVTIADGAEHLHVLVGADGTAAVLFDDEDERYVALRPPDDRAPVGARGGAAAVAPWSDPVPVGPAGSEPGAEAIAPDGELWRVAAAPGDAGRLAVYRRGVATAPQTLLLPPPAVGATDAEPALALPGSGGAHVAYLEQGTTGEDGHCSGKTTVLAADVPRAGAVPRAVLLDSFRADGAGSAESCAFADGRLVSGPPLLVTDAPGADTAVYPVRSFPSLAVAPEARHRDAGGVWPNLAVPAERVADGIPEGLIGGRGRTLAIVGGSVTVRRADGSWSALAPLAGVDGPRAVQAARTGLGTTVTAWVERGTGRIVGRVVDADGVPGDPVLLAPAAPGAMMLAAGGDTEGNGVALFSRPQDDAFVLLASGFDAAGPRRTALDVPSDGAAGVPLNFAAAGLDVWSGLVTDVTWDFGDGTQGAGAAVRHAYADAGARVVRMRLRDASGNATDTFAVTEIGPGPSATPTPTPTPEPTSTPAGGAAPPAPSSGGTAATPARPSAAAADTRAPAVSVKRGPHVHGRATLVVATDEAGRLTVTVTGERRRGECVASGDCRRTFVAATITRALSAGTRRVSLPRLRPGSWTATATVTDAAGNRSRTHSLRIRTA